MVAIAGQVFPAGELCPDPQSPLDLDWPASPEHVQKPECHTPAFPDSPFGVALEQQVVQEMPQAEQDPGISYPVLPDVYNQMARTHPQWAMLLSHVRQRVRTTRTGGAVPRTGC